MQENELKFISGYRWNNGGSLRYVGSDGFYWMSSAESNYGAYNLYFTSGHVDPQYYDFPRASGFSVRVALVKVFTVVVLSIMLVASVSIGCRAHAQVIGHVAYTSNLVTFIRWTATAVITATQCADGYRYYYSGDLGDVGDYGLYWLSSARSIYYAYSLYLRDGRVDPKESNHRSNGFPVRCFAVKFSIQTASGFRYNGVGALEYVGISGNYWLSSTGSSTNALYLLFYDKLVVPQNGYYLSCGHSVR